MEKSKHQETVTLGELWKQPEITDKTFRTGLYVKNSLAGKKVEFIPSKPGKNVTWYGCGPTVYDAAHLGHARTYVSFDTLRRILRDYFGYQVLLCMNITDIDDKIIQRSNEKSVKFTFLARYWEAMFWKDMQALNVELPDVITRVSEYVPQVIQFIQRILDNGFAYVSNGCVYFDTQAFRSCPLHVYGRMEPFSVNDKTRVLEGEGSLTVVSEKKCPLDFTLWKKSKEGEPSWKSPWGPGRPGWHIECSAMASAIFGFPLDIHSGGIDLRFPHHDNELAQSEAHYNRPHWVNYFFHSGHLHIKGSKMSKSEKNFITIHECLRKCSPRVLRLSILSHRWDAPMNYSPDDDFLKEASELDKTFIHIFAAVISFSNSSLIVDSKIEILKDDMLTDLSHLGGLLGDQHWDSTDVEFLESFLASQHDVDEALKDNFDTPSCLTSLRSLASQIHVYLKRTNGFPKSSLVLKAANHIFNILQIFGVTSGNKKHFDYLGSHGAESSGEDTSLIKLLANFRHQVRLTSRSTLKLLNASKSQENLDITTLSQSIKNLLNSCDELRSDLLLEHGIQLEDGVEGCSWKKLLREEVLRQQQKSSNEVTKKHHQHLPINNRQSSEIHELAHVPPKEFFKISAKNVLGSFDDKGVPLTYIDDTRISETEKSQLEKTLEKHRENHITWSKCK